MWTIDRLGKGKVLQVSPSFFMGLLGEMTFEDSIQWCKEHAEDDLGIDIKDSAEVVRFNNGHELGRKDFLIAINGHRHRIVNILSDLS